MIPICYNHTLSTTEQRINVLLYYIIIIHTQNDI